MLNVGGQAPLEIDVVNLNGEKVKLSDFLGSKLLLYFYPKDFTLGCTKEACNFRDSNQYYEKMGFKVIGVSTDDVTSHNKFKDKYGLNFDLLSDPEHKLAEAFGAWQKKNIFGKLGFGIIRSTFVIDETGEILKVWAKVKAEEHNEEVLAYINSLNAK